MMLTVTILLPAFFAGLIVLATHVPLGQEVLRRGIIFLDLAIAQIAGLGAIIAASRGFSPLWVQGLALFFAFAGSLVLAFMGKRYPAIFEALIGSSFILAASAGILFLAANPHGAEHLQDLLAGQILWVQSQELIWAFLISACILLVWFAKKPANHGFYLLFAPAVMVSVQLVGVYLVFASLIFPALAAKNKTIPLLWGYGTGIVGFALGLALSFFLDLPAGPLCCWLLAATAVGASFYRRSNGRI